jgi:hypothetical protein
MTTQEVQLGHLRQMRHLDLLAYLFRAYPTADPGTLGRMSRDGLLAWEAEARR